MSLTRISVNNSSVLSIEDEMNINSTELVQNGVILKNIYDNGQAVYIDDDSQEEKFSISDNNQNAVLSITDGHIKTKNYDSKNSPYSYQVEYSSDIFKITDASINQILRIEDGHIRTKNFDSRYINVDTSDRRKLRHIIGYGQSLMAGSYSGSPVTITQPYNNIKMFSGGVRPYDMFGLSSGRHAHVVRNIEQHYGEMFIDALTSLSTYTNECIQNAFEDLIPAVERMPTYRHEDDSEWSYIYDTNGSYTNEHQNGETPLTAFATMMDYIEAGENYTKTFNHDWLVSCAAYGSASYFSLLPFDMGGTVHNPGGITCPNINYFEILMLCVKKAKEYADANDLDYSVDYIIYLEESVDNSSTEGVAMSRVLQLFSIINSRVKSMTHQRNDIIFLPHMSSLTNENLTMGTIYATICNDEKVVLSSSDLQIVNDLMNDYIIPYSYQNVYHGYASYAYQFAADYGHHSSLGQREVGCQMALNVYNKRKKPIYPKEIYVKNNNIYLTLDVIVEPICIDDNIPIPQSVKDSFIQMGSKYGFILRDDSNNVVDIISNVEVQEGNIIKISCSSNPKNYYLTYAYDKVSAPNGVGMRYGAIRDSQTSPFQTHIYNWLYTFKIKL